MTKKKQMIDNIELFKVGEGITSYIENYCKACGWTGKHHYASNDYQLSNCTDERIDHAYTCTGTVDRNGK